MGKAQASFSVNVTIYSNQYLLQYLGCWGGPWDVQPTSIQPHSSAAFTLSDNNRGGIWYRAIDPATGQEAGFVTMSFTCPELSDNSAEGSPGNNGFISAGLQTYEESGHPLNLVYKVGTPNQACWSSGNSNNNEIACSQTNFGDTRLSIEISNPNAYQLRFGGYWNDNSGGAGNWYWAPGPNDVPPPSCKRTLMLTDNDRAGIFLRVLASDERDELGFACMSFTNPKLSSVSAEGSPGNNQYLVSAGLQHYARDMVPYSVSYEIGNSNSACWNHNGYNDGTTVCPQTTFKDKRALIIINNTIPEKLAFSGYWNDNSGGSSNWYVEPNTDDTIPADGRRMFVLKDNDRAGVYFKASYIEFHMSFTCPKLSDNSAEGSPSAGLQTYSENGTPVTFTYNVGTPNLACWASGTSNNGKVVCRQTLVLPFDLRRWMGRVNGLYPRFKTQTLRKIFIPGTHDSACYSVFDTPWAQTQSLDFYEQLMKGVRYFDVRPYYMVREDPYPPIHKFHHGIITTQASLDDLITGVTRFYSEDWQNRQNEIVILDFSHFDNYSQENGAYQSFIDVLANSTLNQYLIPTNKGLNPTSTLDDIWNASPKGRVFASVNFDPSTYNNITNIWSGSNLFAPGWDGTTFWPNTSDQQTLINFINSHIATFSQLANLWVLQDLLTPGGSSVYSLVDKAHAALYGPTGLPWRSKANIVIQDYYDERTTVESIMENIKRLS